MIVVGGTLTSLSLERVSLISKSILKLTTLFAMLPSNLEDEAARNISWEEGALRRSCRGRRHEGSFGIGVRSVHFREGSIQRGGRVRGSKRGYCVYWREAADRNHIAH